ncbi:MAG TPA: hypothetical protein ENI29_15385 [bacterium]|nr:hypothetical protein [bacterium]
MADTRAYKIPFSDDERYIFEPNSYYGDIFYKLSMKSKNIKSVEDITFLKKEFDQLQFPYYDMDSPLSTKYTKKLTKIIFYITH